ncbi:transmembrane protein 244 isoform X2 [Epinephelus fuscoguttatus]|uniref:transmembrane protein 244 isoform X2 n=1 Tax=Epinephelus fuscoguttatus TaxID=293821 RepID=UPI0020D1347B|nr:transmembrane protein 244 isoform X2 [Epinephelus fuscoguttatus]
MKHQKASYLLLPACTWLLSSLVLGAGSSLVDEVLSVHVRLYCHPKVKLKTARKDCNHISFCVLLQISQKLDFQDESQIKRKAINYLASNMFEIVKIGDHSSPELKVVLQNLLICMVCFYSLYYIVVSVCIGLLRVHEINSLLAPFDYTTQPSWQNPKYLVGVISTEVTYVLGGLVFAWIVEEWVWDYAITVTLLHVAMTVAVMSDFPSAEHWWIALGSGLVMMIFGGQLMAYKLFRSNFVYPAELQNF